MKGTDALKLAGIVAAGVAAYLVVSRTVKAGGDVVAGVKKVVTEDLNPASPKNVVTTAIQSTPAGARFHTWLGDRLGQVFDSSGYATMKRNEAAIEEMKKGGGGSSNTAKQSEALTGAAADAVRESERQALRRMEAGYKDYVNPLAGVETQTYNGYTVEQWNTGL